MRRKLVQILITMIAIATMSATAFGATQTSPFSGSGYSSYIVPTSQSGKMVVNGIDVSVFQSRKGNDPVSNVRWANVKNAGIDYAILRVGGTYAASLSYYSDVTFEDHYKKAKDAGMMTGVYWLSQAMTKTKAVSEAKKAVALLQSYGVEPGDLEFPVYMDYEFVSGGKMNSKTLTRAKATAAAKAFCDTIESYGYQSGIYASTSFYDKYIDASQLSDSCRLWIAQYYNRCQYTSHSFDMWQYSSSGKLTNMYIDSNNKVVDCNFWYLNDGYTSTASSNIASGKFEYDKYVTFRANGQLHKPEVTIYNSKGTKLKEGTSYTLSYIKNTKKGTAYVYVRGIGRYSGYKVLPYTITSDKLSRTDMSECADKISFKNGSGYSLNSKKYLKGVKPNSTVKTVLNNIVLADGYTAEIKNSKYANYSGTVGTGCYLFVYKDGILEGVAEILVNGDLTGDGSCSEEDVDYLARCAAGFEALTTRQKKLLGVTNVSAKTISSVIDISNGKAKSVEVDSIDTDVIAENVESAENAGTEVIAESESPVEDMSAGELSNQSPDLADEPAEEVASVDAASAKTTKASTPSVVLTRSKTSAYKGQNVYITVNAKLNGKPGAVIVDVSKDSKISHLSKYSKVGYYNNKKLVLYSMDGKDISCKLKIRSNTSGTHKVSVVGEGAVSRGTIFACDTNASVKFIAALSPKISKLTSGSGQIKVHWEKRDDAPFTGYQIRYSKNKSMSGAKTVTITSAKTMSKTVSKLAKNHTYRVQVRGYINTSYYHTSWSTQKQITTK